MLKHEPLTKSEFEEWATETKSTLNGIEGKLAPLDLLEPILTELRAIHQNTAAMLKLYHRVNHRTEVLAAKAGLDLRQVDSAV